MTITHAVGIIISINFAIMLLLRIVMIYDKTGYIDIYSYIYSFVGNIANVYRRFKPIFRRTIRKIKKAIMILILCGFKLCSISSKLCKIVYKECKEYISANSYKKRAVI